MDTEETIKNFFEKIDRDDNARYKSWEHCYQYFSSQNREFKKKIACLHLGFYLASWGMYRGSSFLLQKDYLVHMPAVELIIKRKNDFQNIDFSKIKDKKIEEITKFFEEIRNKYIKNIKIVDGEEKIVDVSDTLASKILLGTTGCVPAYDEFFKEGMKEYFKSEGKKYNGLLTLNEKSLKSIIDFYKDNEKDFNKMQAQIKERVRVEYPAMKLVDMYFWNKGFKSKKR